MYPYDLIFGLGLYELLAAGGIFCAMVIFRHLSERRGLAVRLHNFILADAVLSVVGGYFSAVFVQAWYDHLAGSAFQLTADTGATFFGGLFGGAGIFLAVYFAAGHFLFRDGLHRSSFPLVTDLLAVCIPAAHGFGRLGCLMAGCCYGRTAEWGLYHVNLDARVIPVQLYEAVFLFGLCAYLWYYTGKTTGGGLCRYMIFYGVWRFFAEFLRNDDRGAAIVEFLTPSQLVAVVLTAVGLAILFVQSRKGRYEAEQ